MSSPEPEVAVLDFEFPFLCGFGAGVFVVLILVVILRYLCPSRVVGWPLGVEGLCQRNWAMWLECSISRESLTIRTRR